jgi:hypothetical protein
LSEDKDLLLRVALMAAAVVAQVQHLKELAVAVHLTYVLAALHLQTV